MRFLRIKVVEKRRGHKVELKLENIVKKGKKEVELKLKNNRIRPVSELQHSCKCFFFEKMLK